MGYLRDACVIPAAFVVIPAAFVVIPAAFIVIPAKAGIQKSEHGGYMVKLPCVYILASRENGTLYIGVTSNLIKRVWEHKNNVVHGFTCKYGVHRLVWYEVHEAMESAIQKEKRIKKWNRAWKIRMIEEINPQWRDLYPDLL